MLQGQVLLSGKPKKEHLANSRPDDLAALTVKETLKRADNYDGNIDDVIFGNALPEAEQGMNMANNIAGLAGLKKDNTGHYDQSLLFIWFTKYRICG